MADNVGYLQCEKGNVDDLRAHIYGFERLMTTIGRVSATPSPLVVCVLA